MIILLTLVACNPKAVEEKVTNVTAGENTPGGTTEPSGETKPPKPMGLMITPSSATVAVGTSVRLAAVGVYPYGIMKDITDYVTWSADNLATAEFRSYEPRNNLSTISPGVVTITASYLDVTGSTKLTVSEAKVIKLTASPDAINIRGLMISEAFTYDPVSFRVLGTLSDGRIQDITSDVIIKVKDPKIILSPTTKGQLQVIAPTKSSIDIEFENVSTTLAIEAIQVPAEPKFLTISPNPVVVPNGLSTPLSLLLTYTDNTTEDVTKANGVTWISNDNSKGQITITPEGVPELRASGTGTFSLTASYKGLETTIPAVATMGSLGRIEVTPKSLLMPVGSLATFTAMGIFSDGTLLDLTNAVSWTTNNPTPCPSAPQQICARFSESAPRNILKAWAKPPTPPSGQPPLLPITVSASYAGISGGMTINITDAKLQSIEVTTSDPIVSKTRSIPVGAKWRVQFSATGFFSDGTTADLTDSVGWTTQATVAPIGALTVQKGLVTGMAPGNIAIKATLDGVSATLPLTITERTLENIKIKAFASEERGFALPLIDEKLSAALGREIWFGAFAEYSDGATDQPVTKDATWSFSYGVPAFTFSAYVLDSIADGGRWKGYSKGVSLGTTKIIATLQGQTASIDFEVTEKEPQRLEIIGNQDIELTMNDPSNNSANLNAKLFYTDGSSTQFSELFNDANVTAVFFGGDSNIFTLGQTIMDLGQVSAVGEGSGQVTLNVALKQNAAKSASATWNIGVSSKCSSSAGGTSLDRFCWYQSEPEESCTQRCARANADYHPATFSYFFSTGFPNESRCQTVLSTILGLSSPPEIEPLTHANGKNLGCGRKILYADDTDSDGNLVRIPLKFSIIYRDIADGANDSEVDFERVCACRER